MFQKNFLLPVLLLAANVAFASDNIIKNSKFDQGLKGWTTGGTQPSAVKVDTESDGNKFGMVSPPDSNYTVFVGQELPIEKVRGQAVLLKYRYKLDKVHSGKFDYSCARAMLHSYDEKGIGTQLLLAPYIGTCKWQNISQVVLIPENAQRVSLQFGIHTSVGTMSIDDVEATSFPAELIKTSDPQVTLITGDNQRIYKAGRFFFLEVPPVQPAGEFHPSAEDEKRGFVLFKPDEPANVAPGRRPVEEEIVSGPIKLRAARGQYDRIEFGLFALRPLDKVSVSLGKFTDANGHPLDVTVEPRMGKPILQRIGYYGSGSCHVVPKLLVKAEPVAVTPESPRLYHLIVKMPGDAPSGDYGANLTVTINGNQYDFPVKLQILPFDLAPQKNWAFFYYGGNPAAAREHFSDMRAHGMTTVVLAQVEERFKREGDKLTINLSKSDGMMEAYKSAGFTGPVVYNPFHDRLGSLLFEAFGMTEGRPSIINYGQKIYPYAAGEFPAELVGPYKQLIRDIYRHAAEKNWPENMYFFAVDEPSVNIHEAGGNVVAAWRMEAAKLEHRLIKEAVPSAKTFCTAYGMKAVRELESQLDLPVISLGNLTAEDGDVYRTYRDIVGKFGGGNLLWGIDWPPMLDDFNRTRMNAGFIPAKLKLDGMTAWAYYSPGKISEFSDLTGPQKQCLMSYRGNDGSLIPSLPFEGMRAGCVDWQYAETLRNTIAKIKDPQKREQAQKRFDDILALGQSQYVSEGVKLEAQAKMTTSPDELRQQIIDAILEINDRTQ